MTDERDPEEAVEAAREERAEGEVPDEDERAFLESERVPETPGEEEGAEPDAPRGLPDAP